MKLNKEHLGWVLGIVASAGVIVTAGLAIREAPKAHEKIKAAEEKKGEELTVVEKAKILVPTYLPMGLVGVTTISCIIGSNVANANVNVALGSALYGLDRLHKEYRKEVVDRFGEETDQDICETIYRTNPEYHQYGLNVPDQKVIFYDEISGNSITMYEREMMDAEYHFNRNFVLAGLHARLNDFYYMVGMPETEYGETVGWDGNSGIMWVDIGHHKISGDDGGTPIYSISFYWGPDEEFDEWM